MIRDRGVRLLDALREPIDGASLAYFRIAFALILIWEVWRYFDYGWIEEFYVRPAFHFKYLGLGWIEAWPGKGMELHFAAIAVAALFVGLGLFYRLSSIVLFLLWTYMFLIDQVRYQNHFYLVSLLSFLLIFIPAHRHCSLDRLLRGRTCQLPVPAWSLWLLRFQIAVPYVYGGLAKFNRDWLAGEPMRTWLARRPDYPLVGQFFTEEPLVYGFTYGGLLFDIAIVPLLLCRRTRWAAAGIAVLFHLFNASFFKIGIFPWFMLLAILIYFPPDWPRRRVWNWNRGEEPPPSDVEVAVGRQMPRRTQTPSARLGTALVLTYVALQLLVPFRHVLYPGPCLWTKEGHRFSWRMKLYTQASDTQLFAFDPNSSREWQVDFLEYLAPHQIAKTMGIPELLQQFSVRVADDFRTRGYERIEVRSEFWLSVNRRPDARLVSPEVDLSAQQRSLGHAHWLLPVD